MIDTSQLSPSQLRAIIRERDAELAFYRERNLNLSSAIEALSEQVAQLQSDLKDAMPPEVIPEEQPA